MSLVQTIFNPEVTEIYHGEDLFIAYDKYVLLIAEGTGDNLDKDDEENGYVDYFYLEVYNRDEFDVDYDFLPYSIGGGFMMRKELIADELYGKTVKEIIEIVFENNSDEKINDIYDLYSVQIPDYKLIRMG